MPIQAPPGFQYDAQGRLMPDTMPAQAPHPWLDNLRLTGTRRQGAIDAGYQIDDKHTVNPRGEIVEREGFPWGYALMAAGAPLGGMFLPGMLGGGGAGATGGAIPGAVDAPSLATLLGTAPAASGAGGIGKTLKGLLTDPNNLMGLAGVVAALAGGRGGSSESMQNAERMNQITEQRMRRVDPLHQAITQLAWSRLPINSRQGITAPTYQPLK